MENLPQIIMEAALNKQFPFPVVVIGNLFIATSSGSNTLASVSMEWISELNSAVLQIIEMTTNIRGLSNKQYKLTVIFYLTMSPQFNTLANWDLALYNF